MKTTLPADYHTHTAFCRHAGGMPADYARTATALGIPEIACTDHIWFPNDPNPVFRMPKEDFNLYLEAVEEARKSGFCTVLLGLEADYQREIVQGHVQSVLDSAEFDVVLGSLHTGPFWDLTPDDPACTPEFIEEMWRVYFQRMILLAESGLYDVCAHFDLVKRRGVRPPDATILALARPALDAVAKAGMAIELNTSGKTHDAAEIYPSALILSEMKKRGIPITFGSDAHSPAQVGQFFGEALAMARDAGYTQRASFRRRKMTPVLLP